MAQIPQMVLESQGDDVVDSNVPRSEDDPPKMESASECDYAHQELSCTIIGACMRVHRTMGPGFPESVYQAAVQLELTKSGIKVIREHCYSVEYLGTLVGRFRVDFVVEGAIICEFKAVESLIDQHKAQLLSYLKASGLELGLLINFGHTSLQYKRIINTRANKNP